MDLELEEALGSAGLVAVLEEALVEASSAAEGLALDAVLVEVFGGSGGDFPSSGTRKP